jgi:tellurite methyltransferase
MADDFDRARSETLQYHKAYYGRFKLFEKDSWLESPDKALMDILAFLDGAPKILDLGCGVGRNAVPMAQALKKANKKGTVTGVDVLAESITLLEQYATEYGVADIIKPVLADNDDFVIEAESYDLIAAVSTLEHCRGKERVKQLMAEIAAGTRRGGFVRIEMTTDRRVTDVDSKESIPTFVETPLSRSEVEDMINDVFKGWNVIKSTVDPYEEVLEKDNRSVHWCSTQINFTAQKP